MLRWIGTFEGAVICGLCLLLFAPFVIGLLIRLARGVNTKE